MKIIFSFHCSTNSHIQIALANKNFGKFHTFAHLPDLSRCFFFLIFSNYYKNSDIYTLDASLRRKLLTVPWGICQLKRSFFNLQKQMAQIQVWRHGRRALESGKKWQTTQSCSDCWPSRKMASEHRSGAELPAQATGSASDSDDPIVEPPLPSFSFSPAAI